MRSRCNMTTIRKEAVADHPAIAEVNRRAFRGDNETKLIGDLRDGGFVRLSLVAEVEGEIVGHILFSHLPILTETAVVEALALAPVAVLPSHQRRGIGTRLVDEGLSACREAGHQIVVVLGHSNFYPMFGFSAKLAAPLSSRFSGGDSWMAL